LEEELEGDGFDEVGTGTGDRDGASAGDEDNDEELFDMEHR